ncbi:nitrogen regulation protein NR(II) [Zymobacter palmae]|nr:nitrogen regulation protein NR(II) [Zymobacter palmae]
MTDALDTRYLLDHLSTAVILLDDRQHVLWMNPAAEDLLSVSLARVTHTPLSTVTGQDGPLPDRLQQALLNQHPYTQREASFELPNGETRIMDYTVTPLSNTRVLLEMESRDRWVRILREEELLSRQERIKLLSRGMAHEIKNPLGGIRGAAQLLARELTPAQQEYTQVIIEEVDRLRDLVDRMLGPNRPLQHRPLNVHAVLERVAALLHNDSTPGFSEVRIIKDYDPSLPPILGDESQLIQAVLNVARNAMQALAENAIAQPCLTLRSRARRQFILNDRHRLVCEITVEDNGPGIPESLRESLFYPMMSGRVEGTGLGLSIAQSIMHQHQGLIECDSQPGLTQFRLLIPLDMKREHDASSSSFAPTINKEHAHE